MMRRAGAVAVAAALTWTLTATAAHATTTTIGSVPQFASSAAPDPGTTGGLTVQAGAGAGLSYVVPAGYGVITKLRHVTGTASGPLTFKVYRPTGNPGQYLVVASDTRQVTAGVAHSFDVRVPVKPGDTLGISSTTVQMAYRTMAMSDVVGFFGSPGDPDPAPGQTVDLDSSNAGYLLDVAAVVETDADSDGYGDDTQDCYPTNAVAAGACAETTITKAPRKKVTTHGQKAKVKVKFTSPDPAGTFLCSVDGKAFKVCTSPFKKRYALGKHKVLVKAVNALGVADATPAVVKFKVQQKP
jgi:hypothetical protein